eukprot:4589689-Pyramimonas_sp.AAC.1
MERSQRAPQLAARAASAPCGSGCASPRPQRALADWRGQALHASTKCAKLAHDAARTPSLVLLI